MIGEDAGPMQPPAPMAPADPPRRRSRLAVLLGGLLALVAMAWFLPLPALAAPGLCVGPVCADGIQRSAEHSWQLRLRIEDQLGHRERITVDCRDGRISPLTGTVERGYASALARRVCRLAA